MAAPELADCLELKVSTPRLTQLCQFICTEKGEEPVSEVRLHPATATTLPLREGTDPGDQGLCQYPGFIIHNGEQEKEQKGKGDAVSLRLMVYLPHSIISGVNAAVLPSVVGWGWGDYS